MTDRLRSEVFRSRAFLDFVNDEVLPGTGVAPEDFWAGLDRIVARACARRTARCSRSATGCRRRSTPGTGSAAAGISSSPNTRPSCSEIGYLLPEGPDFSVATANVDPEIAEIAGPQLVVPVMNARYALNAANARWGSLYDALYGTDAIPEDGGAERGRGYNPERGKRVIAFARSVLDEAAPLDERVLERRDRARRRGPDGSSCRPATGAASGQGSAAPSPATREASRADGGAAAAPRPAPRNPDRPHASDRQGRSGRHRRRRRRSGDDDDHGFRGFDRRRRRRRQGPGLSQLARPDEGRPDRDVRQGRHGRSSGRSTPIATSSSPTAARSRCPAAA